MNGYSGVDTWSFFYAPFGSVIEVSTVSSPDGVSFVTRSVGARVQTDFTRVSLNPPAASVFDVPRSAPERRTTSLYIAPSLGVPGTRVRKSTLYSYSIQYIAGF